jgi:hypothetical protein
LIKKICRQCGREFEVKDRAIYRDRRTCSNKCRHLLIGKSQQKRIERFCPYCGLRFEATINGAKFCSSNCYWKSLEKKINYHCFHCGKIFKDAPTRHYRYDKNKRSTNIYCSKKCQYDSMRKNHGYLGTKHVGHGRIIICEQCGRSVYKGLNELHCNHYYCSIQCYLEHERSSIERKSLMKRIRVVRRGRENSQWKGGPRSVACSICGNKILRYVQKKRLNSSVLCSPECQSIFLSNLGRRPMSEHTRKILYEKCMRNFGERSWNDKYIENTVRGQLFGRDFKPNELDKKIINAKILLFKIRRSLNGRQ